MTISELKVRLHRHVESGDDRLIRMLYALVYVYETDVTQEKPTPHSYDTPESETAAGEPTTQQ